MSRPKGAKNIRKDLTQITEAPMIDNETRFITKDYFEEQFGKLLGIVEKIAESKATESVSLEEQKTTEAEPSKTPIPPEWNLYIDTHLGKDIGRNIFYPKSGSGFILQMSIPRELSNAPDSHWSFYHHDFRTKAIDPREGFEGVKNYIDLVAKNLKLDLRTVADRNSNIKKSNI